MLPNQKVNKKRIFALLYMLGFFLLSSCKAMNDNQQDQLRYGDEPVENLETAATVQNDNLQNLLLFEEYIESPEPIFRLYSVYPDGTHLKKLIEFSADNEYWVSPNNRYIALFSLWGNDDLPEQTLVVIDLVSGEKIGQVSNVGYLYSNERQMYFTRKSVVWSPTSNKILFERNATQGTGSVIWVYDLTTKLETPLTPENTLDREATWSNDSQYVAYVFTLCAENKDTCDQLDAIWNISIVKVENQTTQTLTYFPENSLSLDPETGDAMFCNLNWSPRDRYIAFENQCLRSGTILDRHRVFVVDATNGLVEEAVKFEQPYAYTYSYHWADEDNLLAGYSRSDYLNFQTFLKGGIIRFDLKQNLRMHTVELLGFAGSEIGWVPGKISFIAFTYEPIFKTSQDGLLSGSGVAILGDLQDQNNLMISSKSQDLPHGVCQGNVAHWSTDGQYVAYTSVGQQHICDQDTNKLDVVVYSNVDGLLYNITESLEGDSKPVSWSGSN